MRVIEEDWIILFGAVVIRNMCFSNIGGGFMLDLKFTGDFLIELCKKKQFVTKQKTDKIK